MPEKLLKHNKHNSTKIKGYRFATSVNLEALKKPFIPMKNFLEKLFKAASEKAVTKKLKCDRKASL